MTRMLPDGRVELLFFRPAVSEVWIAGTFNGWRPGATPMRQAGPGWWVATLSLYVTTGAVAQIWPAWGGKLRAIARTQGA